MVDAVTTTAALNVVSAGAIEELTADSGIDFSGGTINLSAALAIGGISPVEVRAGVPLTTFSGIGFVRVNR